jgi:hypothetical protein
MLFVTACRLSSAKSLKTPVFSFTIQSVLSFAAYWKDTKHFSTYLKRNLFLAPLNNELSVNDTYRNGIISLNKMLLVDASLDRIVVPRTSPVFSNVCDRVRQCYGPFFVE